MVNRCSKAAVMGVIALLVLLSLANPCSGQAKPPQSLGLPITSATGQLTPEQIAQIKAYGEYWVGQLTAKDATIEGVQEARSKLVEPLAPIKSPSDLFKYEYSAVIVKPLETVISGANLHTSANAIMVISQLGTRQALSSLMFKSSDPQLPWQVRQCAAQGCIGLMKSPALSPKEVIDTARRVREFAKTEDNDLILRYRFEALLAAAEHAKLQPEDREKIRSDDLVDAMNNVVDRIDPKNPTHVFSALHTAVYRLFSLLISNDLAAQESQVIGKRLGPALVKALDIARAQWEAAHADPQFDREYSTFIKGCEDFLKRIDPEVRRGAGQVPQTSLQAAWNDNNMEQFEADTRRWMDVVNQSPYAKK